jgi:hypothetical protein
VVQGKSLEKKQEMIENKENKEIKELRGAKH